MGLHLDPTTLAIIGGVLSLLFTAGGTVFNGLVSRNVKNLDDKLDRIDQKLEKHGEEMGHLRERVAVLEDRAGSRR